MLKFRENTESFQQAVLVFQEVMRGNFISQRRSLDKNEQKSISQEEMLKRVLKNIEELKEESTAFEQRLARVEAAQIRQVGSSRNNSWLATTRGNSRDETKFVCLI